MESHRPKIVPKSAVGLMLMAGVFFAIVHSAVKLIPQIPVHQIIVVRAAISILITWWALRKLSISPWGQNRPMLIFRGAAGTGALLLYFYTLQKMPLATAVTIQYLHPILTVVLGGFLLRERATSKQWLCFGASFIGVLLVRGFDVRVAPLDLAIGVASAILSAVAYNLIRSLRHEDHALVVMFYLPLVSLITILPWTLFHYVAPSAFEWAVLVVIGIFTQAAQYFMTRAYQKDTAANISNLNYLGILYATAIGFFVFDESLMILSFLGISLIVVSAVLSTRLAPSPERAPTAP